MAEIPDYIDKMKQKPQRLSTAEAARRNAEARKRAKARAKAKEQKQKRTHQNQSGIHAMIQDTTSK